MSLIPSKEKKINKIKHWLQRNGERDEDGFYFDGGLEAPPVYLHLQYDYDSDGERFEPRCIYNCSNKMVAVTLEAVKEEELDEIIKALNKLS